MLLIICTFVLSFSLLFVLFGYIEKDFELKHSHSKLIGSKVVIAFCSAFLASIAYWQFSLSPFYSAVPALICYLSILLWLSVESFRDIVEMRVPIGSMIIGTLLLFLVFLFLAVVYREHPFIQVTNSITINPVNSLISGTAVSLFTTVFVIFSRKKGLGTADIAFFAVMGMVNGYPGTLNALYISIFSAMVYGSFVAIRKKKIQGLRIPFIPFIALGTLIAFLFGQRALIAHFL